MPDTPGANIINLWEVNARAESAQHIVIGVSREIPNLADMWQQVIRSLSDIPTLTTEISYLRGELVIIRLHRANLAAAGRATLAAYRDDEPNPLSYLRDELGAQGYGLPWEQA